MSRRRRALLLGAAALACAGLAAAMASGYRSDVTSQLGPLRAGSGRRGGRWPPTRR